MGKFKLGETSMGRLVTCDTRLQDIFKTAIKISIVDFMIVCGRREKPEQDQAFEEKKSRLKWPDSKHNTVQPGELSKATDFCPYINGKLVWEDTHAFHYIAGLIQAVAWLKGYRIVWGGSWKNFKDLPHIELVEEV